MPRIKHDAANPARSPTTPPPNATTQSFLEKPFSRSAFSIAAKLSRFLLSSPCFSTKMLAFKHCALNTSLYFEGTPSSVTIITLRFKLSSSPAFESTPLSIFISYAFIGRFTFTIILFSFFRFSYPQHKCRLF